MSKRLRRQPAGYLAAEIEVGSFLHKGSIEIQGMLFRAGFIALIAILVFSRREVGSDQAPDHEQKHRRETNSDYGTNELHAFR